MCGIWGIYRRKGDRPVERDTLERMGRVMPYRGPDDRGSYLQPGIGLGHLRLSIIDLSPTGHQPMTTDDGRYTIVYNGEVYNYVELRQELESKGRRFRSTSDTEVILALYEELGPACVHRFNGMFAMAIWDAKERSLWLVRDRLGVKPLYYVSEGDTFVFASEIKAILASRLVVGQPNYRAIYQYARHMYTTGVETFFVGVNRLLPGESLTVTPTQMHRLRYWDVPLESEPMLSQPVNAYAERLHDLIGDSVRLRLRSDVPVGACLSGGIDSSSIVSFAQPRLAKLNSFSLAFDEGPEYDERPFIAKVRERYPTDHYEITPTMRECWDALPNVVWWMDEPTVASPTVSQYFLSKLARQHVIVALGGQGGDELFGGYYRFFPRYLKQVLREAVRLKRPVGDLWPTFRNLVRHVGIVGPMTVRTKMKKHATMMAMLSPELKRARHDTEAELMQSVPLVDPMNRMFYWEIKNYLPGLLHADDRMSMAVSLESRVPLLDYRVVEFAATIPPELKMRHLVTKYILRAAMRGTTPDAVLDRRDKRGTPSPLPRWFGTGLAEDVRAVLSDRRTVERGLFDPASVERALALHTAGKASYGEQLWMLLNVELWHRTFIDRADPAGPITW